MNRRSLLHEQPIDSDTCAHRNTERLKKIHAMTVRDAMTANPISVKPQVVRPQLQLTVPEACLLQHERFHYRVVS